MTSVLDTKLEGGVKPVSSFTKAPKTAIQQHTFYGHLRADSALSIDRLVADWLWESCEEMVIC